MERDTECVIVGGGIGGAVLALALGRARRQVLILEREITPPTIARPEILAGATMDVFERYGVGEQIRREAAIPLEGLELFKAGGRKRFFTVTQDLLQRAGARLYSTDPASTRRIVLDAAERTGSVQIQRGVEIDGVVRDGSRIVGVQGRTAQGRPVTYHALLTVGDDGTQSRIRSSMGASITLEDFPFDFLGAIMPRLPDQPSSTGQVWLNLRGIRQGIFAGLFLPIPQERTAVVFTLTPDTARLMRAAPDTFYAAAARLSPLCEVRGRLPAFPEQFGYFRRPFGLASRYVDDGVALLGDAAHPVTPAGGQGANSSVADAAMLAEVALEALRSGDCSATRLACYELVRRPANQRSLQFSARPRQTFRLLQAAPWLTPLLRWFLRAVDQRESLKMRFVTGVSQAFTSSNRL